MRNKNLLVAFLILFGLVIIAFLWFQKTPTLKVQKIERRETEIEKVTLPVIKLHQYHQKKDELIEAELKEVFTLFTEPDTEDEKRAYDFYYAPDEYTRLWRAVSAGALEVLKNYKIIDTKIDDGRATVKVYREILSRSQSDAPDREWTQTITITLEKKGGDKWLIDQCGEGKYSCFLGIE